MAMHMIRKGQARWVSGADVRQQNQLSVACDSKGRRTGPGETSKCADSLMGSGSYKFKHVTFLFCQDSLNPEIEGFLVGYRSASSNISGYALYGYPAQPTAKPTSSVTVGPAPSNSPSDGTLLNVFYGQGSESPEKNEYGSTTFSALTGTPTATAQTPLTPPDMVFLLADVGVPALGQPLAQYSVTSSVGVTTTWGWQLFLPEK